MPHFLKFILFSLLASLPLHAQSEAPDPAQQPNNYYTLSEVPGAQFEGDANGRALASANGTLFAIGGHASDGSLLDEVQILEKTGDLYQLKHAKLATPIAFAGAVGHGGAVYLVGGISPTGPSAQVLRLTWSNDQLSIELLPSLPEPLILPGVSKHHTTTKDYLYVLSGLSAIDANELSSSMFELPLTDLDKNTSTWVKKEPLPFGGRIGAVVRETYNEIVVSGGWRLEDGSLLLDSETWGYARIARDGHAQSGWVQRADQPKPVANCAYSKTGQSHLTLAGGDRSDSTLEALLYGSHQTQPSSLVWAFHDPTDTWQELGKVTSPISGGMLAQEADASYALIGAQTADQQAATAQRLLFTRSTKPMKPIDWTIVVIYFLIVAGVGTHFARKQTSSEEFALGNRNVKWWAAGISLFASGVSTISFMAIPALIACIGLGTTGPVFFLIIGVVISAFLTYPLLRRLNITSTFEYLEHRFGLSLRLIGSFVGIITQLMGRIGIVVMLPALAISAMTGLDPMIAILLTGIVTTLYSTAGGFEAVIWTDVAQGILMFAGFIALGVLAFINIEGGIPAFLEFGHDLDRFNFFLTNFDITTHMMWFAIAGQIIGIMSFASDQATAQRVLSTPMRDVRKLAFLFGGFAIFSALIVGFVGISLFAFFKSRPDLLTPIMKNDQIVPLFILSKVPLGMAGLLIATMFAAAMSTVSTSVNSCAVMFGEDFYKRFRKNSTSKEEMRVMQVVSILVGAFGTGLAMWLLSRPMPTLWESFARIMAIVGGGFVGVYILGMFTRRSHELGAIIGVAVSFFMAYYVQKIPFDIHYSGLMIITVGSCVLSGYVSSLIIPWKRKELRGLTVWNQITNEEAEARIAAAEHNNASS